MTRTFRIAAILLLALAFAAPPLFARDAYSLDNAVRQAREKSNGRVISAETREKNGREYYNIRILTDDGKIRRYRYDAGEGRRDKRR